MVRGGSGVDLDNCQRSGVPENYIKMSDKSCMSTFKQKQQGSGVGPGLVLIITKGPGLIWIIAKGPGYLKNLSRSHTIHLYQLSNKNIKGPGWVRGWF